MRGASPSDIELGFRLRDALKRRGVGVAQAGETLGVTQPSMSQKLAGKIRLTVNDLLVLTDAYDISLMQLLDGLPIPGDNTHTKDPSGIPAKGVNMRAWRDSNPQPPDPLSMVSPDRVAISV